APPPARVAGLAGGRGLRGDLRAAAAVAAPVPSARGLLHEESRVRHDAGPHRAGLRAGGGSARGHPPHHRLVSGGGPAVIRVLHVCDHLGWAGSRMHGVKRLFAWMLPRFDRSRVEVALVSLRKKDTSEDTL